MEIDEGEKENNLIPVADSISLEKQELVVMSKSSCENSATPTQENLDLEIVATQAEEHSSSENVSIDMESNKTSGITVMNDRHSTDEKEMHLESDIQTEQDSAALDISSSSSMSDEMVLDKVLLEKENPQTPKSPNEMCETENASVIMTDNESECVPKTDVSLSAENVDKTAAVAGVESPKGNDKTQQMGDVLPLTPDCPPSAITDMREAVVVNEDKCFEMEPSHLDSGARVGSQVISVLKEQEDNECLDEDIDIQIVKPSLSSDSAGTTSSSKTSAEQRLDNNMTLLEEEDGNDGEESSGVLTESKSPIDSELKIDDTEKESVQGQFEFLSEQTETSMAEGLEDSRSSPGFQETEAANCNSLKESTHSTCRRLSPVCLFPTVTVQDAEAQPSPEKSCLSEGIPPNKSTFQRENNLKEDGVVETDTKVSPQESKSKSRRPKCRSSTVSPSKSSKKKAATKNKESKRGQNLTNGVEEQSSQVVREEDPEAEADSPTSQAEYLGMLHSEMGPPLPRLLTPLTTPPKVGKSIHPRQAIGKLSFLSPMEGTASPSTPTQNNVTPTGQQLSSLSLNSPLHPNGVPSSPLQFGSATPKHAVPVPGRLPLTAMNASSSSSSPSQENSMRILDTMYPELSAHGRTLSILRGNVSLGICSSASGTLPNSAPTAFTKTDTRGTKRQNSTLPEPRNSKCAKVDDGSDTCKQVPSSCSDSSEDTASPLTPSFNRLTRGPAPTSTDDGERSEEKLIDDAFKKIERQCFDLLPVLQSHLYVGNKPKKPVLRSEEVEVIAEVCQNSLVSAFI